MQAELEKCIPPDLLRLAPDKAVDLVAGSQVYDLGDGEFASIRKGKGVSCVTRWHIKNTWAMQREIAPGELGPKDDWELVFTNI